jgi:aminoglycoside phosphotransferase (APT) family kinase protein
VIDPDRLAGWMDSRGLPGRGQPIEQHRLSGGSQNEIYEIRRGELRAALRIPPATAPPDRDGLIAREWRIVEALEGTDVPHTPALGLCTDHSVLGRAFYLMGFVDGWSPVGADGSWPEPFDGDLRERAVLADQLIEGAALLGNVDWRGRGLEDLGRPDGFHDRQVQRWTTFFERNKGREVPGFDVVAQWLSRRRPLDYVPGLMHGDYQFANVMFRNGAPARLAAVIDWEMGTVGDPKLDLAWALNFWPKDTWDSARTGGVDGQMHGMPSREQLADRYAQVSGRQVDDLDYYLVLAKWKLGVVLEQGYQRAGEGDERLRSFGPLVLDLVREAADLAESTDYGRS